MKTNTFKKLPILIGFLLMLSLSSLVNAKTTNCWAEFYESPQYQGSSFKITGNRKFKNLNNINGVNWDKRIYSLKVGPGAKVILFEHKNFKLPLTEMANYPVLMKSLGITEQDVREESELIFIANSKIHNLSDFNFYHKTRSLIVECT